MSSMKVYVKATSKNDINSRLENGEVVMGRNYSMFPEWRLYEMYALDRNLEVGTIIATYTRLGNDGYSPVSRYHYRWNGKKCV